MRVKAMATLASDQPSSKLHPAARDLAFLQAIPQKECPKSGGKNCLYLDHLGPSLSGSHAGEVVLKAEDIAAEGQDLDHEGCKFDM